MWVRKCVVCQFEKIVGKASYVGWICSNCWTDEFADKKRQPASPAHFHLLINLIEKWDVKALGKQIWSELDKS